jgi:hypothetical protein
MRHRLDQLMEMAGTMSRDLAYIGSTLPTGSAASSSRTADSGSHELEHSRGRSRASRHRVHPYIPGIAHSSAAPPSQPASQPPSAIAVPASAAAGPVEPINVPTTSVNATPIGIRPEPPAPSTIQPGVIFATGVIQPYARFYSSDGGRWRVVPDVEPAGAVEENGADEPEEAEEEVSVENLAIDDADTQYSA